MKFSLTSLPCRLLALALCFCLVLSLAPALQAAAQPFSDVPADSFAYEDILFLREQGITQGIGNNEYGTYLTFKRCDFVLMLGRLMGWDLSQTPKASDVPQDHYAAGAVAAAEAHGLTESTGSYSFRPDDAITREEMAVMLVRALGISSQAESSLAGICPPPKTRILSTGCASPMTWASSRDRQQKLPPPLIPKAQPPENRLPP